MTSTMRGWRRSGRSFWSADKLRTMTEHLPGRFPVPALVLGEFGRLRGDVEMIGHLWQ